MLEIKVEEEFWDREKEEFVSKNYGTLQLEHSLISLSKWESKWHIPFLDNKDITSEQMLDYVRCMCINKINPEALLHLSSENFESIRQYISDPATATTFRENGTGKPAGKRQIITAEIIYYWMIANSIPFECQKWHLKRLLALIRVCSIKNNTNPKKMPKNEAARQRAALNHARKAKYHTRG